MPVLFSDPLESPDGLTLWAKHCQSAIGNRQSETLYTRLEDSTGADGRPVLVLHGWPYALQGEPDTLDRARAIYEAHVAELAEFGQPPPAGWTLLFDPREPGPPPGLTFA